MAPVDKQKLKDANKKLHTFTRNRIFSDSLVVFPIIAFLDPNNDNQAKISNFIERITGVPTTAYHFADVDGLWAAMFLPTTKVESRYVIDARRSYSIFPYIYPTATMLLTLADMGL